ncbi:MAG: TetR/AcrR family transcriptional regulator [Bradymonadaceae bacterium]
MSTNRLPAEERKKQILENAIHVFAESTYHGATTKRISEEAGVTEALIYRYFGSKRTLFIDAIDHTSSRLVQGLETILEEYGDEPMEAITECFEYYVDLLEKNEELAKMIFLVLSELDKEDIREVYLPYQQRALKAIAGAIDHWKEMGLARQDMDTKTAAWLYFGSYLVLALVQHSSADVSMDPTYAVELAKAYFDESVFE